MCKREGITVLKRIFVLLCLFKHCLWYYIANICFFNNTYHNAKENIDNMLTNGQTDWHRQFRVLVNFYFRYNFANQYALLWTPNAYRDMLMRIFTPCLFFQCVFTNFQCVITLLRALSVALVKVCEHVHCRVFDDQTIRCSDTVTSMPTHTGLSPYH